jgi:hypothetical protein
MLTLSTMSSGSTFRTRLVRRWFEPLVAEEQNQLLLAGEAVEVGTLVLLPDIW